MTDKKITPDKQARKIDRLTQERDDARGMYNGAHERR